MEKHTSTLLGMLSKISIGYNVLFLLSALFLFSCLNQNDNHNSNYISLAGEWTVFIDTVDQDVEFDELNKMSGIKILLPGTLDDAELGKKNSLKPALNNYVLSNLTRTHQYIGTAWYEKEIVIPNGWTNNVDIFLTLERVLWESEVFIDGISIGLQNSLIGQHKYSLPKSIKSGKHTLTIMIDNGNIFPHINVKGNKYPDPINQDMAHAYTNHTQIKWNGILGEIALYARPMRGIENLQIYPDVQNEKIEISWESKDQLTDLVSIKLSDHVGNKIMETEIKPKQKDNLYYAVINAPKSLQKWDEFTPTLYNLLVAYENNVEDEVFGYRTIGHDSGELRLNGQRIFLRGNLECAIFPLSGHPPMEKKDWVSLIKQAKYYGLNHLRFHSWCPPKAAFEAADETGFYFQVELPHWSLTFGEDQQTNDFLSSEGEVILKDYGNHPSFLLMAMGNEVQGDLTLLNNLVNKFKEKDQRHLYTTTAFTFQKPAGTRPEASDEFFVSQWTDKGWLRGQGIFNNQKPHFDKDYTENSDHINVPLISHEIGQYSVYPDLSEIPKYTGVLEPLNFIAIRNDLEQKGLLSLASEFTRASGKLAAMLYKEEIERALKTPGFDGFQLLQLQDFPGQGTALVGLLNAFWESKGIITGEEFRKFNSEVVPLLRFEKAIYVSGERFTADIEVANFYKNLEGISIDWYISSDQGQEIANGSIPNINLLIGNNQEIGKINIPIETTSPIRAEIKVSLEGTDYENSWPIWIYPKEMKANSKDVNITQSTEEAVKWLEMGKKVLLTPNLENIEGIEGRFVPVFWSPVHFPDQPGTMGLLIDTAHAALNIFPTWSYTEWQWWDLCIQSKSINIQSDNCYPIVRVIDNFVSNQNLANVFETKIGNGKLMYSSIDLFTDLDKRPAALQLRNSILAYMESENFTPAKSMEVSQLLDLQKKQ